MKISRARGTQVLFGKEALLFEHIEEVFKQTSQGFGFAPMATPIFESSAVFSRGLGESSDIVSKEMYSFEDRNGESFTLRPEGTAGIARAFVTEGLSQHSPFKVYYQGPMFRYERPQKGRYRQFHQLGVENIGITSHLSDLEVIALGHEFLNRLGLMKNCELQINSIGDEESRAAFREKFVNFLAPFESELSEDSQKRLKQNPLRIFDSKSESDQKILEGAPKLEESLNSESKLFRDLIFEGLSQLGIPFHPVSGLVRGLDYYTHVVFEFVTKDLGAQGTVLAGGRYDHLVEQMGGPSTSGVGFAAGIERLALLLEDRATQNLSDIMVIPIHGDLEMEAFKITEKLRKLGFKVFSHFSGNMSKRMKKAHSQNLKAAVLVGPEEIESQIFKVKDFRSGEQMDVAEKDLEKALKTLLSDTNSKK